MFPDSFCYSKWSLCEGTKVQTAQRKQPKKRNPTHLHLHSNVLQQPWASSSFKVCTNRCLKYSFQYPYTLDTTIQPEKHSQHSFVQQQWPSWAKHSMTEIVKTMRSNTRNIKSRNCWKGANLAGRITGHCAHSAFILLRMRLPMTEMHDLIVTIPQQHRPGWTPRTSAPHAPAKT